LAGRPVALVVPHAGWRFSGAAAAAAFRTLKAGDFDRVVVVAPCHRGWFEGFSIADVDAYSTPVGTVPLCGDAVRQLRNGRHVEAVPGVHEREHSIEIELPFLQERLERFCLVPILAGQTDAAAQRALAEALAGLNDGRTLFVFSSDFTHYGPAYGYVPYGRSASAVRQRIRELDERALGFFSPPDAAGFRRFLRETGDTICGRNPLGVLLELVPRIAPRAKAVRLATYASIDLPGMTGADSVSYAALAYVAAGATEGPPMGAPPALESCPLDAPPLDARLGKGLLEVARATLHTELRGTKDLRRALRALPEGRRELGRRQAAFVTLNRLDPKERARLGPLRGCMGQIAPTYALTEAVVVAAAMAALEDPRFPPVAAEELDRLAVELTVLMPPRPVASWRDIELGRHGITLSKNGRRAVFLPQVPGEQGWTLEETLRNLSRKAGLASDAWREGARFEVFEGQKFAEPAAAVGDEHGG
jgi:AmmeMemoRadiSam system protein B/AmmeMemoRadiSam system protein A